MFTDVSIIGAGAFGVALATSLSGSDINVNLYARNGVSARALAGFRISEKLPTIQLPLNVEVKSLTDANSFSKVVILSVPMQQVRSVLEANKDALRGKLLIAACKGLDINTGENAVEILSGYSNKCAILSGPSFAYDIARGLPTALTVASYDLSLAQEIRDNLRFKNLRLYSSNDVSGVCLGGALKNVIAIAAGICMGASLGESARSALVARGFSELSTYAISKGARLETLTGLSGIGDLMLTCGSDKSRNFRYGISLGSATSFDRTATVEGAATAKAILNSLSEAQDILPITYLVSKLIDGSISVEQGINELLNRELKDE